MILTTNSLTKIGTQNFPGAKNFTREADHMALEIKKEPSPVTFVDNFTMDNETGIIYSSIEANDVDIYRHKAKDMYAKDDNSHYEDGSDVELFISDDLEVLEKNTKAVSEDESDSKEESNRDLLTASENPKSLPESSFGDSKDSVQQTGGATGSSVTNISEEDSFVNKTLPIQEFGTRSFLRSFLNSLDSDENEVAQLPDKVTSGKQDSESRSASSTEAEQKENVKIANSNLSYKSKVGSGSITFNFNTIAPMGTSENVKECYVDSRESSFSSTGFVNYSDPLPNSRSLSLRSDASTTSGKSFAFPVLQTEWHSSPARMVRGDRRNFRKHKCWRSGLLCCRF